MVNNIKIKIKKKKKRNFNIPIYMYYYLFFFIYLNIFRKMSYNTRRFKFVTSYNTHRRKLVIVGDGGCSKTCLLIVFKTSIFQ